MNPFVIAFRRIIYSIPLKRLLVLLAVFGVLFASFSNALTLNSADYPGEFQFLLRSVNGDVDVSPNGQGITCVNLDSSAGGTLYDGQNTYTFSNWNTYCTDSDTVVVHTNGYIAYYWYFFGDSFMGQFYPNYTSLQCQTEYNLIPISSVDQNYCTTNNLCPSQECPEYPDNPNLGTSNIYINDIFHPGAFNVIMNIPEEIDWDYAYTNSGQNFNIDVVGYNQDFEKIEGRIETNNYKPSSEDFTNIFTGGFSNFGGLLVATLFVILVFYFVKKMFK